MEQKKQHKYLISRHKLVGELEIIGVLPVENIDPSDEMLVAELEVRTSAPAPHQPDAALLAHLADDDGAVAEVDVAFGQPLPVVHQYP